jgi:hypothetical protein
VKWSEGKYQDEAYRRMQPIINKISGGQFPMGFINLLSKLPQDIEYPDAATCRRIAEYIMAQLVQLKESMQAFAEYNFEFSIEPRGDRATIRFTFSPDDVRKLAKKDEEETDKK